MKDVNKLYPVSLTKRVIAFLIDSFIVNFTRSILIQILILFWLQKYIANFAKGFEFVFGANVKSSDISSVHISYLTQSQLFPRFLISFGIIISIGFIYNLILLSTKWSATIGQKIVGIFAVSKNEKSMKWYQIIARSFWVIFPLNAILFLVIYQIVRHINNATLLSPKVFMLIIGIGLLVWYDMFFFTKDKLFMHDFLSATKIVQKNENVKDFLEKIFDFMDKFTPDFNKLINKIKKIRKKNHNQNKKKKK
jgi:uncharacterized RDD family membrane protein YckC